MATHPLSSPMGAAAPARSPLVAWAIAGLLVLIYLATAMHQAARLPLWMDEVLTVWLLRLGGPGAIYHALTEGAQAQPPAHPWLLSAWTHLFGSSYLSLRLPSILAGLVTGLSVFALLRRYLAPSVAVLGLALCLCGNLYSFDLQVRPYILTVACYALALLLWDDLRRAFGQAWPRYAGIVLLLSIAIAMHYYSALYLLSFGLVELLYGIAYRRIRPGVWLSLLLAGLSTVLWLPLAHHLRTLLQAEGGREYYASATFHRFSEALQDTWMHPLILRPLFLGLVLTAGFLLFRASGQAAQPRQAAPATLSAAALHLRSDMRPDLQPDLLSDLKPDLRPLLCIALGSVLLPFFTFAFSKLTHGAFNGRYILPGTLGAICLVCVAAEFLPGKRTIPLVTALLLAFTTVRWSPAEGAVPADLPSVLAHAPKPYPVVLPEGLLFFEAQEDRSLGELEKGRLLYLTLPSSYPLRDSTNEHLLERWKTLQPGLQVSSADSFLAQKQCFYLFDTHHGADDLTDYLPIRGLAPRTTLTLPTGDLAEFCPTP